MPVPVWIAAPVIITGALLARVDYNLFFMKFFRNLSRSKARARLHNNKYAIIPVMLGIETPIKIKDDIDAENALTITRDELEDMDGYDGTPLYLSIKGRVYDVSAGTAFYGEGKEYHDWVGTDASRSFGTGCRGGVDRTGMDCLSESVEGLTKKELKEIDRWLELYETHDKYTFIGHLVDDPVNDILDQFSDEEAEEEVDVDVAEEAVDVAEEADDVAEEEVDVAEEAVNVAEEAVDVAEEELEEASSEESVGETVAA